ncbi:energy transducer TonB [Brenneria sp. 4F2]|nr:energy transducer TonB [Brenneria bubanii]
MYWLYRSRHAISWLPLPVVAACLMVVTQQSSIKVQPHYDESAIELSLADPTPAEPETPPVEKLPEPEPEPVVTPEPIETPEPIVAPPPKPEPKPEPRPQAKPKPTPRPKPVTPPTNRQTAAVNAPSSKPVAAPTPAIAPPKVNAQALENGYIQALRGQIEQLKRYPTGRQASLERPEGKVEVWLEVDRNGRILNSGINQKAASMLLNRAATSTLQSITQVKPFPADAFAGQNTKRFLATFHYQAQ